MLAVFLKLYQYRGTEIQLSVVMNINVDISNGVPIYRQIANQVRYMVASRSLLPDEELPSIRALAKQIRVTPNTVVKAYEELESAGVITKRRGARCFISAGRSPLAGREKRLILEQRIDAMLLEAHQFKYRKDELFKLIHKRMALMNSHDVTGHASGEA